MNTDFPICLKVYSHGKYTIYICCILTVCTVQCPATDCSVCTLTAPNSSWVGLLTSKGIHPTQMFYFIVTWFLAHIKRFFRIFSLLLLVCNHILNWKKIWAKSLVKVIAAASMDGLYNTYLLKDKKVDFHVLILYKQ